MPHPPKNSRAPRPGKLVRAIASAAKRGPRGDSRLRVLEAAGKLFSRKGFAGTSVDEIAEDAGASPSSIYWHFKGGKDDILLAVIEEATRRYTELVLDAVRQGKDTAEKFDIFLKAVLRQMEGGAETIRLIQQMALERSKEAPAVRDRLRAIYRMFRESIAAEMLQEFPVMDRAMALRAACVQIAVYDGLFLQSQLDPEQVDLKAIFSDIRATGMAQIRQTARK
ncbi:MAG: TetR/AcrR family transcriptional regulator [Bdellovibrionota bacterium]